MRTSLLSLLLVSLACSNPESPPLTAPDIGFMGAGADKDGDQVPNGMDLCDNHGTSTDPSLVNEWGCTIPTLEPETDYIVAYVGSSVIPDIDIVDSNLQPIVDWNPSLQNWSAGDACVMGPGPTYAALRPSSYCGGPTPVAVQVAEKIKKGQLIAETETVLVEILGPDVFIQATNVDDSIQVAFEGQIVIDAGAPASATPNDLLHAGWNEVTWSVYNDSPGAGWTWALFVSVGGTTILDESCGMPGAGCKDQSQGLVLTGQCRFLIEEGVVTAKECSWTEL